MDSDHSNTSDDSWMNIDDFSTDTSPHSSVDSNIDNNTIHNNLPYMKLKNIIDNNKKRNNDIMDNFNNFKKCQIPKPKKNKNIKNQKFYHDDIVISGVSGRFPDSDNVNELANHLFSQKNFTTTSNDIWNYTFNDKVHKNGQIRDSDTFDAPYFGISKIRAKAFNNELRFLVECVGEAIIDSGYKIEDLRKTDTGVFIGCNATEEFGAIVQDDYLKSKYTLSGCVKTMYANHIRDIFELKGPISCIDADNMSSLIALEWAISAMRNGKCTNAIVGGIHTNRESCHPLIFGIPKGVDDEGRRPPFVNTKYYRTETVGVLFLQRRVFAKRIYATVFDMETTSPKNKTSQLQIPTKINCTPYCVAQNKERLERCLGETYNAAFVDERDVGYVELSEYGHNSVTKFELDAIFDVLAFDRTPNNPLFVGSVTTSIGHAGPASGILSIIKVIISMENNLIPSTQRMNLFALDSLGLDSKKIKVVFENTPLSGDYAGINSISFKNYFSHALLRRNTKVYGENMKKLLLPKLLVYQGRSQESLIEIFNFARSYPNDDYLFQILCEQAHMDKKLFPNRGYILYNNDNANDEVMTEIGMWDENIQRSIWFFFKLDGDDYIRYGKELMKIPYFDISLRYSSKYLYRKYNLNVYRYFATTEKPRFEKNNIMLVIGITVTLALYDMLKEIGIYPSGFIGYSISEIFCAYGCEILSREQVLDIGVLYSKLPFKNMNENHYKAALLRSSFKNNILRDTHFDIVCEVSDDYIIVVGETTMIDSYTFPYRQNILFKDLTNPYDCFFNIRRNIDNNIKLLKNGFEKIFPNSRKRYPTWISTTNNTYFKNRSGLDLSGSYFIQNTSRLVKLNHGISKISNDSIVVILGTGDTFIKNILINTIPHTCKIFQMFSENTSNIIENLLNEIGRMYVHGCDIYVDKLYPKLPYPAPRGTPMIGPHWRWSKNFLWNKIDREQGNELQGDALLNKRHEENRHLNPKFAKCDPHSCWCVDDNFINGPIFAFVED
uniref:Fatty acid synthase n=1 Tax=Strongyloides venezuelensis TaxID=75913 RepID=A0A0K0FFM0_STRVS